MSSATAGLRGQMRTAQELRSVVRTMKALAAAGMTRFARSVEALAVYDRTVALGLGACLREIAAAGGIPGGGGVGGGVVQAVVFGSDQGLVGRFNESIADHAVATLAAPGGPARELRLWAVGDRVHARLADAGLRPRAVYPVPVSVDDIPALIGRILVDSQQPGGPAAETELHLFYNTPLPGACYASTGTRLLPLDDTWRRARAGLAWPAGTSLPELVGGAVQALPALIGEHLFVSLFRACAESLASENASRLASMERADRNIGDLLESLGGRFNRERQAGIDAELFDVVAGFEALTRR